MSFKLATIAALIASPLLVAGKPFLAKRQSTGSVDFTNNTPDTIPYTLVGESGNVMSGSFSAGSTTNLPMSPDQAGYSLKLAAPGAQASGASGILQFEYTYNSMSGGFVSYDWSCVNCNPDPYSAYVRSITPAQPSSTCTTITCQAGEDDASCEFPYNEPTTGPVVQCPDFNGVVITASIG